MKVLNLCLDNELYHYGIKRRSGRYPYGSGKRPFQSDYTVVKRQGNNYNTEYSVKDENGNTISKANLYDFDINDFNYLLLADVETSKKYRGKGMATSTINKAVSDSKKLGKGVYLLVRQNNENAISLYEKLGFETAKSYDIDGKEYLVMSTKNGDIEKLKVMNFS